MNDYLTLSKKIWEMEVTETLNASTILMYLFILHKLSNVEGNEVCITDTEMVKKLSLKRSTLSNSRRILQENELINYTYKNGKATRYNLKISSLELENNSKKSNLTKQSENIEQSSLTKKETEGEIPGENNAEKDKRKFGIFSFVFSDKIKKPSE